MKVIIKQPVTMEQVKASIAQQFPNYQLSMRTSSILVVKKSGTAAALVMVRSGKIIINEGFPSMGGQMLFTLSILLLGILIPIIVYFAAFFPGQKAVRNEVGAFIQATFG
ncbi:MAG TPA: hypothetical protein VFJ43_09485 [Bacteroidia bacterium]|nr:hypothetical protein [Bacteroidia bacterium]